MWRIFVLLFWVGTLCAQEIPNYARAKVISGVADGVNNKDATNLGQIRPIISKYNEMRGQRNLITNGFGEDNTLYNFSGNGATLIKDDVKEGTASFYVANNNNLITDEFIPYNPSSKYQIRVWAKTKQGYNVYVNLYPYDSDLNFINLGNIKKIELTVATAFTAGATSITVTTAALTNNPYFWIRNPIYTSQSGRVYNDVGYSQQGARCVNSAIASTTINLQSPIGFAKNAGDKIYVCEEASSLIYPIYGNKTLTDTEYQLFDATFANTSDVRLQFTAKLKAGVFGSYTYATPFPNRYSGFAMYELDPNSIQNLNLSNNFTGNGKDVVLDLSNTSVAAGTYNTISLDTKGRATSATNTPYLPLTSTTNQTLNYGSNVLNINGQINLVNATTRLIAQYGEGEHGYDDGAGVRNGLVFSDGQVHIRSTNGSNWSGIGVLTNGLPNVYYPGSTTANEGDALVLTNPASGEIKFGKTKKKIAYPPITSTITLTDEDVVIFHGANGNFNFGSTIYNLPNTPNFCGRTVSFINDWGYNNSSSYMKANSTLSNIENVAGGGFTNSLSINFKAKLVCTCASGGVYWMQE
jgi:hypothetical protein